MLNIKTIAGTLILLIAAQQLLMANEYYRTGKLTLSPVSIGLIFIILVSVGIFLIVKGIKRNQPY